MFQLTENEVKIMVSQNAIPSKKHLGGSLPYAFSEHGTLMLASVLNSDIAIAINQRIIEAFVAMKQALATQPEYELLRERIRRIESEIRESKMNQLVDSKIFEGKLMQLSQGLQTSNAKIDGFSAVIELFSSELDEFEKSHIIIKKPEDGLGKNQNN